MRILLPLHGRVVTDRGAVRRDPADAAALIPRSQPSARSISEKLLAIGVTAIAGPSWRSICEREIRPRTRAAIAPCGLATSRWLRPRRLIVAIRLLTLALRNWS